MGELDHVFMWAGYVVVTLAAGMVGLGVLGFGIVLLLRYFPRVNVGVPVNMIRLTVIDKREILATKDGVTKSVSPLPSRIIRQLDMKWWVGLSCRRRSKWFFGFIRWEEAERPS